MLFAPLRPKVLKNLKGVKYGQGKNMAVLS